MNTKRLLLYILLGICLLLIGYAACYLLNDEVETECEKCPECETCECQKNEEKDPETQVQEPNPEPTSKDVTYYLKDLCPIGEYDKIVGNCTKEIPITLNNKKSTLRIEFTDNTNESTVSYVYKYYLDNTLLYEEDTENHCCLTNGDYVTVTEDNYIFLGVTLSNGDSDNRLFIFNKDGKKILEKLVHDLDTTEEYKKYCDEKAFSYELGLVTYWEAEYGDFWSYLVKYQATLTQNGLINIKEVDRIVKNWGQT